MHELDSVPLSDTRFFYWLLIGLAMYPVVQFAEWVLDTFCCFCRRRSQFNIGWGNVNSNGNQSLYRRSGRRQRNAQDKDPEDPTSSEDDSDSD